MDPNPKKLLYSDAPGNALEALPPYYTQAGNGESRLVSRSVWEAIGMIPETAGRLLDVGCHVGYMGQIVKAGRAMEIVGVELDPAAAQAARQHLDTVIVEDIEQSDCLPLPEASFDCITMLDVVEHLILPQRVFAKLRRYLRPSGCLICSIPNVRHISVLKSLLLPGHRWTIEGQGMITDPPHLRFFALNDILKLLSDTGFSIDKPVQATCSNQNDPFLLELADHLRGMRDIPAAHVERLRLEFSVFQFVFRAVLSDNAAVNEPGVRINPVTNSLHRVDELISVMRERSRDGGPK
jgi:SAM-dependent methyltransferase